MWTCPACHLPLVAQKHLWQCENGHHYDMAKEGYVNLLLANQKRSKEPGDSKQMIVARRDFLELDHYQLMANRLACLISENCESSKLSVFDAGCGEGYYLQQIKLALQVQHKSVDAAGVDISKPAILKAAKKYRDNHFAVASTYKLPLNEAVCDAVIQIFAPSSEEEVLRVLKPGGIWIQVNPSAHHLNEVKHIIYAESQEHTLLQTVESGFQLVSEESLTYTFTLQTPKSRLDLLMMTPYFWSARESDIEELRKSLSLITADFHIRVLKKENALCH